jgi:hypothetical protein
MSESKVNSLPAAAYVLAKGAKFLRCEPDSPSRVDFVFDDPLSTVSDATREFFSGAALPSRDYYRALQDLRLAINRHKNGGRQ